MLLLRYVELAGGWGGEGEAACLGQLGDEIHRNAAEQCLVLEAAAPAGLRPGQETEGCRCTSGECSRRRRPHAKALGLEYLVTASSSRQEDYPER